MSAPHPGAPHHPHGSVSISSFVESCLPSATESPEETLKRKFFLRAFLVAILQILGLIVATILYYSQNEPAAIVVLCGGYFSRYFLVSIAGFIQLAPPNAEIEVRFAWLYQKFATVKYLFMMQLLCIYLQRDIVPDLWPFAVAFMIFVIETGSFIKSCFKYHSFDATKTGFLAILIMCAICCAITQLVFFGIFAKVYATTSHVESILKMGALFVSIFFGQIADIVMIVITKNWEVPAEVSGTEV
jgi:F0F1-type ATP synthase membrane subunit c/vacuolar-type H+-ATPase subunit K